MRRFMGITLCLFLLMGTFSALSAQERHEEEMPSMGEMQKMAKLGKIMKDWGLMHMWAGYTMGILEYSVELYKEDIISGSDGVKVASAVKDIRTVFDKRITEIEDATIKEEAIAIGDNLIKEADAYIAYFKGDESAKGEAEKYREEVEKHYDNIDKYFETLGE